MDGSIYLISPDGFSNWGYIVTKTLYTGAAARWQPGWQSVVCWAMRIGDKLCNVMEV